mmetsp:Transcript_4384/g.4139  ORF Transcript_4384/g.4139 Transcript_4384/m.4139 type:complete len:112 (-) Transcript_4384:4-339(-)
MLLLVFFFAFHLLHQDAFHVFLLDHFLLFQQILYLFSFNGSIISVVMIFPLTLFYLLLLMLFLHLLLHDSSVSNESLPFFSLQLIIVILILFLHSFTFFPFSLLGLLLENQ